MFKKMLQSIIDLIIPKRLPGRFIWGVLRIVMGWLFLWPFLDKLFGLGFTTPADKSWLMGVSPTSGFLKFVVQGPFSTIFQNLTNFVVVDWLFMLGLVLIGLALILGIGMKIASYTGSLLLLLIWLAVLPPAHNPFLDEHIIYMIVLIGLVQVKAGYYFGLGKAWSKIPLVKKYTILE